MLTACVTRLDEPIGIPLGQVGKRGFTTLIAGGFVDTSGPTLSVVVVDGQFQTDQTRAPILRMTLNPFSQSCHIIGYINITDEWCPVEELEHFLSSLRFGSCPTLLIPSAVIPLESTQTLCAGLLKTFGNRSEGLAKRLLTPEQIHSELLTFLKAWDGAIQFQYGARPGRSLMPTDEFMRLLVRLCASCDLPFFQ
jgi:hypothetical protein